MMTGYQQLIRKVSPALALLVISTFVSSVGADGQRTDFQRARTLMAKQRSNQALTEVPFRQA